MNRIAVVTAYVPLKVKHLNSEIYHAYGERLAAACDDRLVWFDNYALDGCWLARAHPEVFSLPPATDAAPDRYDGPADFVRSNVVQHNRTTWALEAIADRARDTDVVVWLDLAILKQGAWNGNPVTEDHIRAFLSAVERYSFDDIPFPGIGPRRPVDVHGNNWRFCGSTHIWPVKWLPDIDRCYRYFTLEFIRRHKCVPLDLAIWPTVEERSALPFNWYKAEYDHTQLSNFPGALDAPADPPLRTSEETRNG